MTTTTETTPLQTASVRLPHWMYSQIIHDESVKAVWCYCGAYALSYCNGLQFVCFDGHAGVPMKAPRPRPEDQVWLEAQIVRACEVERQEIEAEEAKQERRRRKPTSKEQAK